MSGPPSRLSSTIRFNPAAGKSAKMEFIKNFRPEDVGNITLWLDASDSSTITFQTGTQVLSWGDKKFKEKNFVLAGRTLPVYNATGFNGRPTIIFGADKGLKNDSATPYTLTTNDALTIFLVGQITTTTNFPQTMFRAAELYGETPIPLDIGADPLNYFNWFGTFNILNFINSAKNEMVSNTVPTVVCFTLPAGESYEKLFLNANSTPDQSSEVRLGASLNVVWDGIFIGTNGAPGLSEAYWNGPISEVLIYDTELSDSNITKVSAYLGQKWGFKSSLTTPYNDEQVFRPVTGGASVFYKNEIL